MFPMVQKQNSGNSGRSQANFGDNPTFGGRVGLTDSTFKDASGYGTFRYEPPEGYNALCTANLPDPPLKDPSKYFTATKYRGNGNVGRKVTTGLEPALVIIKPTNFSDNWIVNGSPFGVEYYSYINNMFYNVLDINLDFNTVSYHINASSQGISFFKSLTNIQP